VFSIIGLYIAFMVNYYVNQMCGRARPGWMLAVVAATTFLLLSIPLWNYWYAVFYFVFPGNALEKSSDAVAQLAGYLFGTGLCEEGYKSLPLFALALLGGGLAHLTHRSKGKLSGYVAAVRKRICLCEPLDGIVFGVASGSGFFLAETLGDYLPKAMHQVKYPSGQAFDGLVLLLARGLPDLTEHSAWTGLFGYFIGLTVLQPRMAIVLVPLGWFSAAALHAGWDGISSVTNSGLVIVVCWMLIGLLSYALLAGAIFKARDISPRLALNPAPKSVSPTVALTAAVPVALEDDSG
jgi:RsiW-degrading membrane proteinase PrsW (M82 family)